MSSLTLIPTPLGNLGCLSQDAFEILNSIDPSKALILVEEPKASRRAWLSWGLSRQAIEHFIYFNEQSENELASEILSKIKSGIPCFLLSDGGLPGFCDPGQKLISLCHDKNVLVKATSSYNSVAISVALSGFAIEGFEFLGFAPRQTNERSIFLNSFIKSKKALVLMDTAYKLPTIIQALAEIERNLNIQNNYFLALDLYRTSEVLLRGSVEKILKLYDGSKKDFVLVKDRRGEKK